MYKAFRTQPGLTIFLLTLPHVILNIVYICETWRGDDSERHWDINFFSPEVHPIVVLELALREGLLWKCFMSTFICTLHPTFCNVNFQALVDFSEFLGTC